MHHTISRSAPLSNLADALPDLDSMDSTPIETRFFLGSALEEGIAQLRGVQSVRITTSQNRIDEIQVLAAGESSPLALRDEVLSCSGVGFGLLVDDRCIRVIQSL